ncbi:CATRA system-associated protein [Streptomyces sp. NPDC057052]|uniref:CATRA system-associated protein n=1 Tax=Streptomyces sp. NPDC057052 TaxID=3346010 RepID=UPI003639D7F4
MTPQQIIERLKGIKDWQLTPQQWDTVGDVLNSLEAVLAEEDDTKTIHVLARLEPLERAGAPRRAQARLGAGRTPIPPQQREQRNHLIERLTVDVRGPADRSRDDRENRGTAG